LENSVEITPLIIKNEPIPKVPAPLPETPFLILDRGARVVFFKRQHNFINLLEGLSEPDGQMPFHHPICTLNLYSRHG
jgi:hypothetical protein